MKRPQTIILALLLTPLSVHASEEQLNEQIQAEVLLPAVAITTFSQANTTIDPSTYGSGIFVQKPGDGACVRYVLTNHHVIENTLAEDGFFEGALQVSWPTYHNGHTTGSHTESATIVTYDDDVDLALLELYRPECTSGVRAATLLDEKFALRTLDTVWFVSAVSGKVSNILPIECRVTRRVRVRDGRTTVGISTEVNLGQSGGGVFKYDPDANTYALGALMSSTTKYREYVNYGIPEQELRAFLSKSFASP